MGGMIPLSDASRRPTIAIILAKVFVLVLELARSDAFTSRWSATPADITAGRRTPCQRGGYLPDPTHSGLHVPPSMTHQTQCLSAKEGVRQAAISIQGVNSQTVPSPYTPQCSVTP